MISTLIIVGGLGVVAIRTAIARRRAQVPDGAESGSR
jgi:hypothetical protein